jgi:hypothetical protein
MEHDRVGFERDVRPLFRDKDVQSMSSAFDLSSYADVRANADKILTASPRQSRSSCPDGQHT